MPFVDNKSRFSQASGCLSSQLYRRIVPLADRLCNDAMEIRLRVNRPLTVVCSDVTYFVTRQGGLTSTPISNNMLNVTKGDISDTFHNICNYSVYSRQNEIVNGFVTLQGGHRAGISGTAVVNGEVITNIRDISSINIRIAREYRGCAKRLDEKVNGTEGILICGAPCCGKTTVLRDYVRILSTERGMNVSLIDERGEIAGVTSGVFQNDVGFCDIYDGYRKSEGMMQALRSMSPDVIACDEIGADDDVCAVEHSINCGVKVIATVHAANAAELKRKRNMIRLISDGAFEKIVFLSDRTKAGEIIKVMQAGDILAN